MNRKELTAEIKQFVGAGCITRKQVAEFLGYKDPHYVDQLLRPLIRVGKTRYFVSDVATAIMDAREMGGQK